MMVTNRARILAMAVALMLLVPQLLPGLVSAAPPAPLLSSPADGSAVSTLPPTVSWEASTGASLYQVDFAQNPEFWGKGSGQTSDLSFTPGWALSSNSLYYWRVTARNSVGAWGPVSATWRFWTPLTLISPANGTSTANLTPTLDWSDYAAGGDPTSRSYLVQIAGDASFSSGDVLSSTTTASVYTVPGGALSLGRTYYWRVNVSSTAGTSGWSEVRSFSTPLEPPETPSLLSPANASVLDNWRPLLTWNSVAGATSYKVHYVRAGSPERTSGDLAATSLVLDTFWGGDGTAESSSYEWWIEAKNSAGSAFSEHWTFSTPPRQQPSTPVLLVPANGSTVSGLLPVFDWADATYTKNYRIVVGTGSAPWGITGVLAGPTTIDSTYTYPPANYSTVWPMDYDRTYFWQVVAYSIGGISAVSPIWSFKTPPAPGPELVAPTNGETIATRTPTLSWVAASAALSYTVQVSSDASFAAPLAVNASVDAAVGSSYTLPSPLEYSTTYYWRVNFTASTGTSLWSEIRSFKTPAPPPPGPDLLSPATGSTASTRTPTLSWSPVTGALSYTVQVATSESFATPLVDVSVDAAGGGSYALSSPLDYSITYYWRVRFTNGTGTSLWSSVWNVKAPPPPGPDLLSPTDGSTVTTQTPTLYWSAVTGALSYRVQVARTQSFAAPLVVDVSVDAFGRSAYTIPSDLEPGATYYWRVSFADSVGTSLWSVVWRLKGPGAGPDLLSPADGSAVTTRTPTLSWSSVPGAVRYQVQMASTASFEAPLIVDSTVEASSGTWFTIPSPIDYSATYYWRVNFTDSVGTSLWSVVWSLQGPPPIPLAPSPQSPGSPLGGSIIGFRPTFDWIDSANATTYGFQVATNPNLTWPIVNVADLGSSSFEMTSNLTASTTYYWRANASNTSGTSAWSTTYSFTTPLPPPAAPTLIAPTTGSTTANLKPYFDWSDSDRATSYTIQLYTDAALTSLAISTTVSVSQYVPASDLAIGITYYWRVRAANETSLDGPWSSALSFTTPEFPPPAALTLLAPGYGEVVDTLTPTLRWEADAHADNYRLQLSTFSDFPSGSMAADVVVTSIEYVRPSWNKLVKDTVYYWRVRGNNAAGAGSWSDVWVFRTPPVPTEPTPIAPSNGATVDGVSPTLTLNSVPFATSYTVQLSTAPWLPAPTVLTSSTPDVALTTPLVYGKQYYWRANASNAAGTSGWSSTSTFTTPLPPPPPDTPTLLSPINGTVVGSARPTLDWSDVPSVTKYRIVWSKSPTFQWTEGTRDNLIDSTFTLDVDLVWNTQYYWRVTATGEGGDSAWSSIASFRMPAGPPGLPTLLSPADGMTSASPLQKLDWSDVVGAESYQAQISSDAAFATTLVDSAVASSELTLAWPLAIESTYYWRVKAVNGVGDSGWTSGFSFTVPAPPGAVTLISPDDGTTVATLEPTLDWDDVAGATAFEVQYSRSSTFSSDVTVATVTTSTYTISPSLPLDVDYYWQLRALNDSGFGPLSAVRRFHTPVTPPPVTEPPAAPNLVGPAAGANVATLSPTFSWETAARADGYYVQLSRDAGFGTLVTNDYTTAISHTLSVSLSYATMYYWKIQATNNIGATDSAVRNFTTPPAPAAQAPVLLTPADGVVVDTLTPTLDWENEASSSGYVIQLSTSSNFSYGVTNVAVTGSEYVRPSWSKLAKDTAYYWRVRGTNATGAGDWSDTRVFRTPPMPTVPTLVSPIGGVTLDGVLPTLTLNSVPFATSYTVQISTASWFAGPIVLTSPTPEITLTSPLSYGKLYYWRANATNAAGTSAWSISGTFRTPAPPAPPAAPTPLSPIDGAVADSARPTLNWSDVSAATKYRLEWSKSATFQWTEGTRDNLIDSAFTMDVDLTWNTLYYWRVRATGLVGDSVWSSIASFRMPAGPPGLPALLSPTDGSIAASPLQKLDWSDASGAGSYQVQVSTDPTFGTTVIDSNVSASEFTPASPLSINATYYWRVKSINGLGDSGWTSGWSFAVPPPPGSVTLLSPQDGITIATLKPNLDWDDVAGATAYEVKYSPSSVFSWGIIAATVAASTFTVANNLPLNTDYYWQVRAQNGGGFGPWSSVRRFHTPATPPPATEPPAVPTLLDPADKATVGTATPTFLWGAADRANGYRVQVSTDSSFGTLVSNDYTTAISHTLSVALSYSTPYYWRIQATNNVGPTNSAVRSFSTPPPPPPPAPVLLSPADASTIDSLSPLFDWADSPYAKGYRIQISTVSDFRSLVDSGTVSVSQYSMAAWKKLRFSTVYYWKVQPYSNIGSGDWSSVSSFTTADPPPPPPAPTLIAPGVLVGGSVPIVDSLRPSFSWDAVGGAISYRIQVSRNAGFTSLLINSTTTEPSFTVPGWQSLAKGTQYWWKVQATNSASTGSWSVVYTFKTSSNPVAPILLSPGNGSTADSLTPTLDWGDVDGATSYHVMIGANSWFGVKVADVDVTDGSSFTPTNLTPGKTYYWKVYAKNGVGTGGWSVLWSFTTPGS
ncbi:MAG: hypothetical protein EPO21_22805 [Chloroflexota bacterium]|nr:MAG: hypothetical protein EPO21_22805 [Chloroflexota bacterium]